MITDLRLLADQVYDAIRPWARAPLAVFGHSMGATVGYEVVRRLERDGLPAPLTLFASGRRAPSRYRPDALHRLDDRALVMELLALGGTDPAVVADEELLSFVLPAIRGDYKAIETYRCPEDAAAISVPIAAVIGDDDPLVDLDEVHAWREHTSGPFHLEVWPGGHFYLSDRMAEMATFVRSRLGGAPMP